MHLRWCKVLAAEVWPQLIVCLDTLRGLLDGFFYFTEPFTKSKFIFEDAVHPFGNGVLVGVSILGHAWGDVVHFEVLNIDFAAILKSSIGVVYKWQVKITGGTPGAGKVLKSDANGLASWNTLTGTDVLSAPIVSTNLSCPVVSGSVVTGSNPRSVAVSGIYAYVVNNGSSTLQVINITNPAAPVVAGSVATGSSPASVAVSGNHAYVVNFGSNTLQVIDISNPAAPTATGSVETGSVPGSVAVSGSYAYVANHFSNTMQVIDISNPAAPVVAGLVATETEPFSVAVSGNYAYVVNLTSNTLQVINISNPLAPTVAGSVATGNGPYSVTVSGNYAYVVNYGSNTLQVIDISNPTAPTVAGSVATGTGPSSVALSGNYAYVANYDSNTLQVINLACSENFAVTVNPATGQTTAQPLQWINSGNNMYNANNGNVGIGTTSPGAKLEVAGQVKITGGTPGAGKVLKSDAAGLASWGTAEVSSASNGLTSSGSNITLGGTLTTATSIAQAGFSFGFIGSGNVGIGTTTPSNKLEVVGAIKVTAGFKADNGSASVASYRFDSDANTGLYLPLADNLAVTTGGSERMRIASDGNMGIGTTTPAAKLDVAGKTKTTDFQMTTGAAANTVLTGDGTGNATWTPSTSLAISETDPQVSSAVNNQVAKWNGSSLTDGIITDNGTSVGIGINNPNHPLHLVTSSIPSGKSLAVFQNLTNDAAGSQGLEIQAGTNGATGTSRLIQFRRPDATILGGILQNSTSSVAYNTTSDIRLKTNIKESQYGLKTILNIQVKDYNYKDDLTRMQTGFIAQQLFEQFPQSVAVGGEDPKSDPWMVDYSRLSPVIVKAVQELNAKVENATATNTDSLEAVVAAQQALNEAQQAELAAQQAQIEALERMMREILANQQKFDTDLQSCCFEHGAATGTSNGNQQAATDSPRLEQNIPNPFRENTTIKYYLPSDSRTATITISDLNGVQLKQFDLQGKGFGQVLISGGSFAAGTYVYTLTVNGKVVDSKRMVLL
jgi:hypothetical protein